MRLPWCHILMDCHWILRPTTLRYKSDQRFVDKNILSFPGRLLHNRADRGAKWSKHCQSSSVRVWAPDQCMPSQQCDRWVSIGWPNLLHRARSHWDPWWIPKPVRRLSCNLLTGQRGYKLIRPEHLHIWSIISFDHDWLRCDKSPFLRDNTDSESNICWQWFNSLVDLHSNVHWPVQRYHPHSSRFRWHFRHSLALRAEEVLFLSCLSRCLRLRWYHVSTY